MKYKPLSYAKVLFVLLISAMRACFWACLTIPLIVYFNEAKYLDSDVAESVGSVVFLGFIAMPIAYLMALPGLIFLGFPAIIFLMHKNKFSLGIMVTTGTLFSSLYFFTLYAFSPELFFIPAFVIGGFLTGWYTWWTMQEFKEK